MSRAGRAIEMAAVTDRGRLRERNEDAVAVDQAIGVAAVADGMGGLHHGDRASRQALAAVFEFLSARPRPWDAAALRHALSSANSRIRELGRSAGVAMGTTAVVLAVEGDRCRIAHVGDSRAYHFRGGELWRLTTDHSLVQEMVDRGVMTADAARHSNRRHIVTRALGLDAAVLVDIRELELAAGDLLLLCSDGLWEMLADDHIAALLAGFGTGRQELAQCAAALVNAANGAGGLDNVSVVLARY